MKTVINKNTDPFFNLALEEYLLKQFKTDEDIVLFWRNIPSIIVGRNQNPFEEINKKYLAGQELPIVRRISGGGTVYHDLGNLNYSFITSNLKDSLSNYKKFTKPIINALIKLGVPAYFKEKSDILVQGNKISGNAQSYFENRMLHHGTILYDTDLAMVYETLHKNTLDASSKSIKSNRSKVQNINTLLTPPMTINEFEIYLLQSILGTTSIKDHTLVLTNDDLSKIILLSESKYHSWKWNYGETPEFIAQQSLSYINKDYDLSMIVRHGYVQEISVDPPNDDLLSMITKQLQATQYNLSILQEIDLTS